MLDCQGISVSFGGKPVLSDCSLTLRRGQRFALMGPSGCGKTTLLRVLLSLQKPDCGTVRIDARRIGAVFQEPRLLPWCTASENVNAVLSDCSETLQVANHWLDQLELSDAAGLLPDELSGGMQQRVSIARALAIQPELLLLDEPFKGLDSALHDRVISVVEASLGQCALLLATHSEEEAHAMGCQILCYSDGQFL